MDGDNLKKALYSKKFWAMIVGLIFVFVGPRAGIDADTLTKSVAVLASYLLGQGLSDAGKSLRTM